MSAVQLTTRRVEKPWGRHDLGAPFGDVPPGGEPVGEIWFAEEAGGAPELLVKYLFTSERLSIQVHPDDDAARAAGYPRGKSEAWLILEAEPHATIGIGMREVLSRDELRAASLDGRIENLLDWRAVRAGDVFYSPAGTVHALGPGLKLIEVQQNVDLTYRLYDYGRPRELHLDEGVAVSNPVPYVAPNRIEAVEPGRTRLVDGPAFVLERLEGKRAIGLRPSAERPIWIVPVAGSARVDGQVMQAGTVWRADGPAALELDSDADLLLASAGGEPLALS